MSERQQHTRWGRTARRGTGLALGLLAALALARAAANAGEAAVDHRIDAIPAGYTLQAYDDCGVAALQPHLQMLGDTYLFTYGTHDNDGDLRARSAAFSYKVLALAYEGLDPERSYALALVYATDQVYKRVQSLWANGVELHPPLPLPKGRAIRVQVRVPEGIVEDGRLALEVRIHGEVNATASEVELWSDGPAPAGSLQVTSVWGVQSALIGRVVDLRYAGIPGAAVELRRGAEPDPLARTVASADGAFRFVTGDLALAPGDELRLTASAAGTQALYTVPPDRRDFTPVTYRPLPATVDGLTAHRLSLDGTWRLNLANPASPGSSDLAGQGWHDVRVPGQWRQQGFEVPPEQTVAMARVFEVPPEWAGYRLFLRFEAVHAGTTYWLNGKRLGYSECLFTPVEWEVTGAVLPGKPNRLDLEMKVATISEQLSYSSGYAFHNLGGIDRTVSLLALPKVHVRSLRLFTDLDAAYCDADLRLLVTLDSPDEAAVEGLSLTVDLRAPDGQPVAHSRPLLELDAVARGATEVLLVSRVDKPLKWNAEQPNLYALAIELRANGRALERIERSLGFRKVEVKGGQVCVNGAVVTLAGACHHEVDPLSGRADTAKHAERDVELLKQANLNTIRTSHYPPTRELVEAADRIGMYVEVEAPFCWVAPTEGVEHLWEILTPTTAMLDTYNSHPSVLFWSVANESDLNEAFVIANRLVKELDPSRLTTFNHPFGKAENEVHFDLANRHYPGLPYEAAAPDTAQPLVLGEYNFPVCHEQTDVMINPGLRELWGHGHADPGSAYAKECAESFARPPLKPGTPPGAWTAIRASTRVAGGMIWASHDDSFYFPDGTHAGYSWVHGFWGLIDAWRRPKPEWWLAKLIYAPVWFPKRQVGFVAGQSEAIVPVENRHAFTDLNDLRFAWELDGRTGLADVALPPALAGEIAIPVPAGTRPGQTLVVRCSDKTGRLVTAAAIVLGEPEAVVVPKAQAGFPEWHDGGRRIGARGRGFALVFDRQTGALESQDPAHTAAIVEAPALHLTRYDFGDLAGPKAEPYEVLPKGATRVVDQVGIRARPGGLEITVRDHYEGFAGSVTWLIDRDGLTTVRTDYTYSGHDTNLREVGVRLRLAPGCDRIRWRRWSEWGGVFPDDSISRTEGTALAWRPGTQGPDTEGVAPTWPWSQDQTALGTADFRSIRFHVYEAALTDANGRGARALARGDRHVRASLDPAGVWLHLLSHCPLGQVPLKAGDRIADEFTLQLLDGGTP
jgi:hypothetical protein